MNENSLEENFHDYLESKQLTNMYFIPFVLINFSLMVKDYVGLSQQMDKGKDPTGQSMLISLASINFMFWVMVLLNPFVIYHIYIAAFFVLTHIAYIVLWLLSNTWLQPGAHWGSWGSMNSYGKFNSVFTAMLILPFLYLLFKIWKDRKVILEYAKEFNKSYPLSAKLTSARDKWIPDKDE